jgi:hypothetical protein
LHADPDAFCDADLVMQSWGFSIPTTATILTITVRCRVSVDFEVACMTHIFFRTDGDLKKKKKPEDSLISSFHLSYIFFILLFFTNQTDHRGFKLWKNNSTASPSSDVSGESWLPFNSTSTGAWLNWYSATLSGWSLTTLT